MASSIQLLRSTSPQERPFAGNLLEGQPAANLHSSEPGLFFKTTDGSVVKFGPAAITSDGSPPNSTPQGSAGNSVGELWLDKSVNPAVLKVYDGAQWVDAGSGSGGGSGSFLRWIYTAIGGETSLSGSSGGVLLDYTPGLEEVYVNGVLITRGTDYSAINGTSITNLAPLIAGDVVTVLSMNPLETVQLPGQVTLLRWSILAAAGQTVLSGIDSSSQQLAYTAGFEEVYVNGAFLRRGADYTATSGTSITLSTPLNINDEITVLAWTPFIISSQIVDADVSNDAGIRSNKLAFSAAETIVSRSVQEKLEDVISVKDFGAVGNGIADDTLAFRDAIDAANGGYVFVPLGEYRITGPLDDGISSDQIRLIGPSSAYFSHSFIENSFQSGNNFTPASISSNANLSTRYATIKCDGTNLIGSADGVNLGARQKIRHIANLCVYGYNGAEIGIYFRPFDTLIENCHFALFEKFGICIRAGITSTIRNCSFNDNGWNLNASGSANYPSSYISGCAINIVSNVIPNDFTTSISASAATTLSLEGIWMSVRQWSTVNQSGYRGIQARLVRGLNLDNVGSYTGNYFYLTQASCNNFYVENYATKGLTTSDSDPHGIYTHLSSLSLNSPVVTNNTGVGALSEPIFIRGDAQSFSPNCVTRTDGKTFLATAGSVTSRWDAEVSVGSPGGTSTYTLYDNSVPNRVGFTGFLIVQLAQKSAPENYSYGCFFVHKHSAGGAGSFIGAPVSISTYDSGTGTNAKVLSGLTLTTAGAIQFNVTWGAGWAAAEKFVVNFGLVGLDSFSVS